MKGNVYRLYIEQIRKVVNKRKKRSLEENSVMNKRRIVKEIMNPYMDKNGFTLAKYERGDWYYRKKIEGALLEICISDANGRLHMHIGIYGKGYDAQAEQFLGTLTAPRTSTWDWDYWRKESEEKKEKAYKDTLYDFRDILELNGKEIFEKIVTDYKNRIPNRKHYLLMMEHYDELEKKYSEELCTEKCNIVELWEKIAAWVEKARKYPLEEIEERLIGYVTVMETEMIKRYGGERENNQDAESCFICNVGNSRDTINFMARFFLLWKNKDAKDWEKREIESLCNEQLSD